MNYVFIKFFLDVPVPKYAVQQDFQEPLMKHVAEVVLVVVFQHG